MHAHSGPRSRAAHVLRGSDLTLVKELTLRPGDQFIEILTIHDAQLALSPTRPCDPVGYNQGAWAVLEFSPGRNFSYMCTDIDLDPVTDE